jgi:hypothetical protein
MDQVIDPTAECELLSF